jgi:hypothetical protein
MREINKKAAYPMAVCDAQVRNIREFYPELQLIDNARKIQAPDQFATPKTIFQPNKNSEIPHVEFVG